MAAIPPMKFIDWWIAKTSEQKAAFITNVQTSENVKSNLKALESYCREHPYEVYCNTQLQPRILPITLDSFNVKSERDDEKESTEQTIFSGVSEDKELGLLTSPLLLTLYDVNSSCYSIDSSTEKKKEEEECEQQLKCWEEYWCKQKLSEVVVHKSKVESRVNQYLTNVNFAYKSSFISNNNNNNNNNSNEEKILKNESIRPLFAKLIILLLSETAINAVYRTGEINKLHKSYLRLLEQYEQQQQQEEEERRNNNKVKLEESDEKEQKKRKILRLTNVKEESVLCTSVNKEKEDESKLQSQEMEYEQEHEKMKRENSTRTLINLHKPVEVYCTEMTALCGLHELLHSFFRFWPITEHISEEHKKYKRCRESDRHVHFIQKDINNNNSNNNKEANNFWYNAKSSWTKLRMTCAEACTIYQEEIRTREEELEKVTKQKTEINSREEKINIENATADTTTNANVKEQQLTLTERDIRFAIQHIMNNEVFLKLIATIATNL